MLLLNAKDSGEPGPIALPEDDPPSFEEAVAGPSSQISPGNSSPSPGLSTTRGALNKGAVEDQRELRSYSSGENLNPETSAPPPGFAPYEAEFETQNGGDIVSHDPHLNDDGTPLAYIFSRTLPSQLPVSFRRSAVSIYPWPTPTTHPQTALPWRTHGISHTTSIDGQKREDRVEDRVV